MPPLGDANGNRLRLLGKVALRERFGPSMYRAAFLVAERCVSVIIGTSFMNRHLGGIMCMDGEIRLTRAKTPILSRHPRRTSGAEPPLESRKVTEDTPLNHERDNVNLPHTVNLTKFITIPAKSQLAVPVRTEGFGLLFIEPKHTVLALHNVRTANGVAAVKGNRLFTIVISNFADQPWMLHKGMTIGYVTRSSTEVYCLNDEDSRAFENVINLPFVRKNSNPPRVGTNTGDVESRPEFQSSDWRDSVDLSHIDDESLSDEIISMLLKHEDMWRPGHLGETTATEQIPGTKPIRLAPHRQGHRGRDVQAGEIAKMLEAGVVEPATSE